LEHDYIDQHWTDCSEAATVKLDWRLLSDNLSYWANEAAKTHNIMKQVPPGSWVSTVTAPDLGLEATTQEEIDVQFALSSLVTL
jgi:hypothetical protein